jgi:hypothetical protein
MDVNCLAGADSNSILESYRKMRSCFVEEEKGLFGGGMAAQRIANYFS